MTIWVEKHVAEHNHEPTNGEAMSNLELRANMQEKDTVQIEARQAFHNITNRNHHFRQNNRKPTLTCVLQFSCRFCVCMPCFFVVVSEACIRRMLCTRSLHTWKQQFIDLSAEFVHQRARSVTRGLAYLAAQDRPKKEIHRKKG